MVIELVLSLDGNTQIMLTEYTIQSLELYTVKTDRSIHQHTKNITMRVKFENINVLLRDQSSESENNEENIIVPDEIDSVRNLLNFAVSSVKMGNTYGIPFLDGSVKVFNEIGEIADFIYKDLFVLSYSEEYVSDSKNTFINIHMRERAR